jgi:hypothetical protein
MLDKHWARVLARAAERGREPAVRESFREQVETH